MSCLIKFSLIDWFSLPSFSRGIAQKITVSNVFVVHDSSVHFQLQIWNVLDLRVIKSEFINLLEV